MTKSSGDVREQDLDHCCCHCCCQTIYPCHLGCTGSPSAGSAIDSLHWLQALVLFRVLVLSLSLRWRECSLLCSSSCWQAWQVQWKLKLAPRWVLRHSVRAFLLPVNSRFRALSCCRRLSTDMWMMLFGVNCCCLPEVHFGGILHVSVSDFDGEANCNTLHVYVWQGG